MQISETVRGHPEWHQAQKAKKWHIPIAGFLQKIGQPTGISILACRLRKYSSPEEVVYPVCPWNSDWDAIAELIMISSDHAPDIRVYAYSWGAGWGFLGKRGLANCLKRRGIHVSRAVLADPVYRSPWWWGRWMALVPYKTIRVPSNVHCVKYFVQRNDWPSGHRLKALSPNTQIPEPKIVAGVSHTYMDELYDFHAASMTEAAAA